VPNKPLQLTAGRCGFVNVFGVVVGFGLSNGFGKPPPQLNFFVRRKDHVTHKAPLGDRYSFRNGFGSRTICIRAK
jgi:hypothetical protein